MHALIIGHPGVGKSTLIQNVICALSCPVGGYFTKKEDALADGLLGSPVYLYDASQPRRQTPENLVGFVRDRHPKAHPEAFDRLASVILSPVPRGGIVVMDEIGTMESKSGDFCQAIRTRLEGDTPVLAAVKEKDTPFLLEVRSHPNCRCFYITPENRDALLSEITDFLREQL